MTLIQCPDCNKSYSDAALACPNCGRPSNSELRQRYTDDSDLLKRDAQRGELEAIGIMVKESLNSMDTEVEVTSLPLGSFIITLTGNNDSTTQQEFTAKITELLNTVKPEKTTCVGISFMYKNKSIGRQKHLLLKDGRFVDNTANANILLIATGVALVAIFASCSAYLHYVSQSKQTPIYHGCWNNYTKSYYIPKFGQQCGYGEQ